MHIQIITRTLIIDYVHVIHYLHIVIHIIQDKIKCTFSPR